MGGSIAVEAAAGQAVRALPALSALVVPAVWQADDTSPVRLFGVEHDAPVVLWLCAGRIHRDDIVSVALARGVRVLPIDILRGGRDHDLRRQSVRRELRLLCSTRLHDGSPLVVAAHIASPCRSFSPLNAGLRLRTVASPDGEAAPSDFAAYIEAENTIITECAQVATTLMGRGAPVTWENSPYLGKVGAPWHWAGMEDCASLWHTTALRNLAATHRTIRVTAAMCRFGSRFRKYFSILAPEQMHETLLPLVGRWCPGVGRPHGDHEPGCGFDVAGRSRAYSAGQYPRALNEFLLDALVTNGGAVAYLRRASPPMQGGSHNRQAATTVASGGPKDVARPVVTHEASGDDMVAGSSDSDSDGADGVDHGVISVAGPLASAPGVLAGHRQGGRVTDGPALDSEVRDAVEAARIAPTGFASYRNLRAATADELWLEPLPQLRELARGMRPEADPEFPASPQGSASTPGHIQWDGERDWRTLISGAPEGRVTLEGLIGEQNLADWSAYVERTQRAFDAIRRGEHHDSPGEFVLRRDALPEWARPFVWDTGDANDCKPVVRSNRNTVFPGAQQVDRAAIRHAAAVLRWGDVDQDIIDQIGEGGMEMRSAAPLHITAMWHHAGIAAHFSVADTVVKEERDRLWTTVSVSPMPYVPCTCSPRDVILQERSKLVAGELVNYLKPRLSHNLSAVPKSLGGRKHGVSTNSAVPTWEKRLPGLPTVLSYGRAWAVCDLAAEPMERGATTNDTSDSAAEQPTAASRSGVYGVDMEKAYCFVPVQQADRHTGCYLWPDEHGVVRVHVSWRMVFGGSPWPNRFERLSLLGCAWVQRAQVQFDEEQPPLAPSAAVWVAKRTRLQDAGALPAGAEQIRPAGIEPFLDDCSGRALCDAVIVPDELRGRALGASQTSAVGARPAPADSRLAVHCAIAVQRLEQLGFSISDDKTMCGSGMALLGALLDTVTRRIRCTEVKRKWILHAVSLFRTALSNEATVDLRLLEQFTGRLTNLSQFFPELRHPLSVGYALSRVTWRTARGMTRRPSNSIHVRPHGRREQQLHALLDVAEAMAEDDVGVSMAPTRIFDSTHAAGVLTVVTDASKAAVDDGFGGYAFLPEAPGVVFMMSCPWPSNVRSAMSWAALAKRDRAEVDAPHGALSMPAGETFAAIALANAVAETIEGGHIRAVVAVGDCKPAASALSAVYSRSPQLRYLVGVARVTTVCWLGVAVPRELNVDADRLSHPTLAGAVAREAEAAGARVVWLAPSAAMWCALEATCRLPMGADPPPWEDELAPP